MINEMSKLHTNTPHNLNLNINQVTSDVIILYNDDGTKVIMVLENGQWLQARWLQERTDSHISHSPKKNELVGSANHKNMKTYEIESQTIVGQPHPKAYQTDESPTWYIDIESLDELSTIGGGHDLIVRGNYILIRDYKMFDGKR